MSDPIRKEDGFTDHEILKEIRDDLKTHIKDSRETESRIQKQLARRPKRTEIVGWITSIAIVSGAVVAVLS